MLTLERRARALQDIGPQGVMVIAAGSEVIRNNDVHYSFRQDSDFYYLTGFDEPDAVLVLVGGAEPRSVIFLRPRDPARAIWDGPRLGVEAAVGELQVDLALPLEQLAAELPGLLLDQTDLFCRLSGPNIAPFVLTALAAARIRGRRGRRYPTRLVDSDTVLHEMRRIKSGAELVKMAQAAEISVEAHKVAMAEAQPGRYEYEVEAAMLAVFQKRGSERVAYPSIVASGDMATTLHYVQNRRQMQDGELLLIDAGCELQYYASDITRTFPVNGKFSGSQREIYDLVLEAQHAAIDKCVVGNTLDSIHAAAADVIARGLIRLGVLSGSLSEALEKESYKQFFMHKTSHYLGLDVHDVGSYFTNGKPRPLQQGVVITVEPGLYFPQSAPEQAARYRGIGVRIEDDIVIGRDGGDNLTADLPTEAREVERLCSA